MNADDGFAFLLAWEMVALASHRVPAITDLCARHHWLIPGVLGVIGLHLARRRVPIAVSA